jgi:hypothetical protein
MVGRPVISWEVRVYSMDEGESLGKKIKHTSDF